MKRIATLIGFIALAMTINAQSNDTLSVVLRRLELTETRVMEINQSLRHHSQLAIAGFVSSGIGAACLLYSASVTDPDKMKDAERNISKAAGVGFCILGGALFLSSYLPIWMREVKMDDNGLTVVIPVR